MRNADFSESIKVVLEKHNVQDEKLENTLIDLFKIFESRLIHGDLFNEITRQQNRADARRMRHPKSPR